ncbi:MAG: TetR/AcrR family transcriptional regulator [Burkholderiaceae bacterium]|nr:TetR/AcrR family transcriptional regulator [Burkholderiaceae bacterium]
MPHADTPGHAEDGSPWAPLRDRQRERALKREAVLRTAARMFNEKGFHATSLDEVAERLNVTKPTLYYYVSSKDEILFECVRTGLEMVRAGIDEVARSGGTAADRLLACMRAYGRVVTMDFGACVIRVGEDPLPPHSRRELRRLKAEIDHEFRNLIASGVEDGSLAPCDPKVAAFAIAGALSWIGRWYRPDGPLDADEAIERCIAVLARGIVAAPSRRPRARRAPAATPARATRRNDR